MVNSEAWSEYPKSDQELVKNDWLFGPDGDEEFDPEEEEFWDGDPESDDWWEQEEY